MTELDRRAFLKRAGVGAGVLAVPGVFGTSAALALPPNGQRIYVAVAFSQSPPTADVASPRIAVNIAGTFKPDAGWIRGGGNWILFDWPGGFGTAEFVAAGLWRPRRLVGYQTGFGPPAGLIEAALVDLRVDFEGLADDVPMRLICNIGPAGVSTGEPEGWKATIPGFGEFVPIGIGITHTSVEGASL